MFVLPSLFRFSANSSLEHSDEPFWIATAKPLQKRLRPEGNCSEMFDAAGRIEAGDIDGSRHDLWLSAAPAFDLAKAVERYRSRDILFTQVRTQMLWQYYPACRSFAASAKWSGYRRRPGGYADTTISMSVS
jgi:hypothetical protein